MWLLILILVMGILYFIVFISPDRIMWYHLHFDIFGTLFRKIVS